MGKKRVVKQSSLTEEGKPKGEAKASAKRHIDFAILHVESTYNNTVLTLSDPKGNVLFWSSSGSLGFKGAKKGTPFAAAKVGEVIGEKAQTLGIKEVQVTAVS